MQDDHDVTQSAAQLVETIQAILAPDCPNRKELCLTLMRSPVLPQHLTQDQRQTIYDALMPYLSQAEFWQNDWYNAVLFSSIIQTFYDHKLGVQLYAYAIQKTTSLSHRAQLFYQIRLLSFMYGVDTGVLFPELMFQHYQDWFGDVPAAPKIPPMRNRAIILLSQVLAPPHAPTVDAFAKYKILQETFGYDVLILNTCESPSRIDLPILSGKHANRHPLLRGYQKTEDGCAIYTPPCDMPSKEGYALLANIVAEWQPAFILNFGTCNFSAEYLGQSTKVITMPAGTELLPTRNSYASVSFRPLTEQDHEMIKRCGMEQVKIIETLYNYDKPDATTRYLRADFNLDVGDFVITVVGTRLTEELNAANITLLQNVLALAPQIKIVFLGKVEAKMQTDIQNRLGESRVRFAGFLGDVPAFYEQIADLYLNPRRIGGGTSGVHALAFGVPAFTLAHGHVASLTHPDFVFADEDALLAAIGEALSPPAHAALRTKALEGFERVGSRERMLRDILTGADVPTDAHQPDSPSETAS